MSLPYLGNLFFIHHKFFFVWTVSSLLLLVYNSHPIFYFSCYKFERFSLIFFLYSHSSVAFSNCWFIIYYQTISYNKYIHLFDISCTKHMLYYININHKHIIVTSIDTYLGICCLITISNVKTFSIFLILVCLVFLVS